jgi:hypothetical protein
MFSTPSQRRRKEKSLGKGNFTNLLVRGVKKGNLTVRLKSAQRFSNSSL